MLDKDGEDQLDRSCERRTEQERNIVHTTIRRKANWIGHILRRNCLLKHIIEVKTEGKIEVTGRRGRKCEQLLGDLKEKRRHCKLKGETLDRTVWRSGYVRDCGPAVRRTVE